MSTVPAPISVMLNNVPDITPIPPFGTDVSLTCTVLLTSGPEINVPLNVTFELLRTDPTTSPISTTTLSGSSSAYVTSAMIRSFERSNSGVYTCRARVSSASANTYLLESDTADNSRRITTGAMDMII